VSALTYSRVMPSTAERQVMYQLVALVCQSADDFEWVQPHLPTIFSHLGTALDAEGAVIAMHARPELLPADSVAHFSQRFLELALRSHEVMSALRTAASCSLGAAPSAGPDAVGRRAAPFLWPGRLTMVRLDGMAGEVPATLHGAVHGA
jgi:hypothetical protein